MRAYCLRRLALALPTLLAAALVAFFLVRVTGDPARFVLGETAPQDAVDKFRADQGLDRPLPAQLASYLGGLVAGDLGTSIRYRQPVSLLFRERIGATLELGLSAYAVSVIAGVLLGVVTARHAGTTVDRTARFGVLAAQSIPGFYLGLVLIITVAGGLRWLPSGGRGDLRHLVLPVLTISAYLTAVIVRFTRSLMLDVLHQPYVRTAHAKGLPDRVVTWRHALRNAIVPLLTVLALQSSVVFSGAVVTETIFSWPGVGRLAVDAILTRDYAVVQGTVFVLTAVVVAVNLLVDVAYAWVDPRIRYA